MSVVVGFDLDMTLIDPRAGMVAVMAALSAETGVSIDGEAFASRLGPPLADELRLWFPEDQVDAAGDRFRALYPEHAVHPTPAMDGAAEALAASRAHGAQIVVITGKYGPNARLHLEHLDLDHDALVGWAWADGKVEALREHGAWVYVGDHPADMTSAREAGAAAVGVPTGAYTADELRAAGADVVLDSLHDFGAWLDGHVLERRLASLEAALRSYGSLLVAFSGGADSAFMLASAVRALGPDAVVAATAVSPSLAGGELERAAAFAAGLGVRHLTPATHEMQRDGYRANAGDRCAFCKGELLDVLAPLAAEHGLAAVATGTNADDAQAGFRPGIAAAAERGAVAPLRDAGLTKDQVRAASRAWGLATWDKPAAACLSSRIAYGIEITPAALARVDRAEAALRAALDAAGAPSRELRVRDLGGGTARIEVDAALAGSVPADAVAAVAAAGFDRVEVDPRGFRSGAMNELLADPERYR
jgi:uncharacterized protein